eukprot:3555550-Amphidinium_carterae.1
MKSDAGDSRLVQGALAGDLDSVDTRLKTRFGAISTSPSPQQQRFQGDVFLSFYIWGVLVKGSSSSWSAMAERSASPSAPKQPRR